MNAPAKTASHGSLLVIFLTVFVDLLGFGIVMPLLPLYGLSFGLNGMMLGVLLAVFSLMQFLFAPIWGRLSDRIGRRPVLMIGLLGSTVFYFLFGLASLWHNVVLLFITRIGAGIAGATIPTAQAYIADCTTQQTRTRGMALIGVAFGLGFTVGPLLAWGALVSSLPPEKKVDGEAASAEVAAVETAAEKDVKAEPSVSTSTGEFDDIGEVDAHKVATSPWPGYVASATSGVALLLAIFLLPESREPGTQTQTHRQLLNAKGWHLAMSIPTMPALLLTVFVSVFSFGGFESTLSLFLKSPDLPFKFKIYEIPPFFAFIGVVLFIVQGGIVRRLSTRVPDIKLCLIGCSITILGFVLLIASIYVADLKFLLFSTAVEVTGFAFITPTINGLISRRTNPAQQGDISGINQSVSAMARIVGPVVAMPLFQITPFAPYFVAIVGMCIVITLMLTVVPRGADFHEELE